jgi:hypothetical protein
MLQKRDQEETEKRKAFGPAASSSWPRLASQSRETATVSPGMPTKKYGEPEFRLPPQLGRTV